MTAANPGTQSASGNVQARTNQKSPTRSAVRKILVTCQATDSAKFLPLKGQFWQQANPRKGFRNVPNAPEGWTSSTYLLAGLPATTKSDRVQTSQSAWLQLDMAIRVHLELFKLGPSCISWLANWSSYFDKLSEVHLLSSNSIGINPSILVLSILLGEGLPKLELKPCLTRAPNAVACNLQHFNSFKIDMDQSKPSLVPLISYCWTAKVHNQSWCWVQNT